MFAAVLDRLGEARCLLLLTHVHPDGDGLGSMTALARAGRAAGRRVELCLPDGLPERYAFLTGGESPACDERVGRLADEADLLVVLDTCSPAQLEPVMGVLKSRRDKAIVIDHHATGGEIAALQWVDPTASATGVMVLELLEALSWPIDETAAEALAAAVTSDTGWMRFENTDSRCLEAMARLLRRGVRPDRLYARLYQNDRPQRLALLSQALASLELLADERVAVMRITRDDFASTGARPDETENIVNESMRIRSVEVAVMLVENNENIRVNLRSRGRVDVSQVAARFGGGGHVRAAGLRDPGPLDSLRRRLLAAVEEALAEASSTSAEPQ